jgi:hypothetical protein
MKMKYKTYKMPNMPKAKMPGKVPKVPKVNLWRDFAKGEGAVDKALKRKH